MPRDLFGRAYLQLGGLRMYLADEDDANEAAIVVCGPVSFFADDVRARCAGCGAPIVHRPTVPPRPPKVCIACATEYARAAGGTPPPGRLQ